MRKTFLLLLLVFGVAGLMGPETLAFCAASTFMEHEISYFACADSTEVSALAYQITNPLGTHTGTEDIACEARDMVTCFGESGNLGDNVVTIETDWGNPGIVGCPFNSSTGQYQRVLVVVQGSNGKGVLVSLGSGGFPDLGGYVLETAHQYVAATNEFLPLDCHDKTGRPRLVAQSANPGNTFTLVLHFEPPLVNTDCDPGTFGKFQGYCLDGFQPNSAVGGVYTSVQTCGAPADLRLGSWTNTGVQPDANGDATITVTQPPADCLLIGGTSIIGGFESGAITGFLTFDAGGCHDADGDGVTDCAGDCDDANAAVHPGATEICNAIDDNCNGVVDEGVCDQSATDIVVDFHHPAGKQSGLVTWRTINEVDVIGFNVVLLGSDGSRTPQNAALIGCDECRTGLGSSYSFIIQKVKSGRNVFVEVVHQDGTVGTFGPAIRQ